MNIRHAAVAVGAATVLAIAAPVAGARLDGLPSDTDGVSAQAAPGTVHAALSRRSRASLAAIRLKEQQRFLDLRP